MTSAEDQPTSLPDWFQIFRQDLNERLTAQDGKLEQIFREARKTNGRVTALEAHEREAERVRQDRVTRAKKISQTREQERSRRAHVLELWVTGGCILLGGMVANLGHIVGLW